MNTPYASAAAGNRAAAARLCPPCLLTSVPFRVTGAAACSRHPPRSKWNVLVRTALGGFVRRRRGGPGRRRSRRRGGRLRHALAAPIQEPDPVGSDTRDLPALAGLVTVSTESQAA